MTYSLSPVINGNQYFLNASTRPASGVGVYAYYSGTFNLAQTYTDSTGTVGNANPMILDSSGRPTTEVWLDNGIIYDFNITGPDSGSIAGYQEISGKPKSVETYGQSIIWKMGNQFFDNNGYPLAHGLIYTYFNGSNSIKAKTWTSVSGVSENPNPIVLDANGTLQTDIYLKSNSTYNFVLCEPNGTVIQTVDGVGTVANPDPYFGMVQLLAHFDGANGSTNFIDNSPNPKSMNSVNNAAISTAESVFGGSSLKSTLTDGSRVDTQDAGCRITGDFTIEFRLRMLSVAADKYFFISKYVPGGTWLWFYTASTGLIRAYVFGSETPISNTPIVADTWYAIALTRSGTTRRLFINGNIVASDTGNAAYVQAQDVGWSIAGPGPAMASGNGNCYIDEVRITNGVARYIANYTPSTLPFTNQ